MYPKGTVYKDRDENHGEVNLQPTLIRRLFYRMSRGIGAGLIGFAVIGLLFAYGPIAMQEVKYYLTSGEYSREIEESILIDGTEADRVVAVQKEAQEYGVDPHFSIVVPKINAKSSVIANVDAAVEDEYFEALKSGIAHAKGTNFPGQGKNIFLFSHSTDSPLNIAQYNADFYLLRKLNSGDKIVVYFSDEKYVYEVDYKVVTGPADVSWFDNDLGGERLVLQTCDPPGTTWKRLIVIAKPV